MTTETRKKLPGSGEDCECGEHRKNCRFGQWHTWMFGYVPEAVAVNCGIDIEIARRGSVFCYTCEAVHVPAVPGEDW